MRTAVNQALDDEFDTTEVYRACIAGEVDKADRFLIDTQQKESGDKAKEIARLRGYLMGNSSG